jgi:hypothetical protein|tara:strand:+ start:579 stop:977 length:399 start_codon:yes stop_codon:yes gene_type:complete
MAKKKKEVKMSVPEGLEFNTSYTLADLHQREHSKYYYESDRNINPFREKDFEGKLLEVTKEITDLLISKNKAYGDTALNPVKIFSSLDSTEALCARIDDKIMRIKNKGINDDTEDTVSDLIGYLLLLKMSKL